MSTKTAVRARTRKKTITRARPARSTPDRVAKQTEVGDAFESGRYWSEPGPPMAWHEELEALYIRAHELVGSCCVLESDLPAARANPLPPRAPLSPVERRMSAIRRQLEHMRTHLVRVMVAGHAHEAILAATYGKPVCDLAQKFFESVLISRQHESHGLLEVNQALDELREVLVVIFRARSAQIGKHDFRLSDFVPSQVEQVRRAMSKCGPDAKFVQVYAASKPMNKQAFCRINRLLRQEQASSSGT